MIDAALEMMAAHAPLLAVLVPLLAAPLAVLFGNRTVAFVISWFACLVSFVLSGYLALLVSDGAVLSYAIGGWAPPLGIEYRVDAANAFVMVIVSAIALVIFPYARTSIETEIDRSSHTLFYACMMLCFTGLMGVTVTGDAFNIFVFLEISSLSTYVLVALGAKKDRRALSAAYDYLVLGTIGATFFVIGLGLIYMMTGTLNLMDLSLRLDGLDDNRTVRTAFAFIVIGLGLKIAIYPLHRWLPGAYTYSPSVVSAFLAATATKVAIYALLRFMFSVFSPDLGFERDTLTFIVMPLAILAMFAGSFVATFQTNVKRLLAYSSVAQVGYMLLGTAMLTATGLTGSIVHLFNHAVTKGALFLAVGCSGVPPRVCRASHLLRSRSPDAVDGCSHHRRWHEPDRRARHRGVRVQMGADAGGVRSRALAHRLPDRTVVSHRHRLCLETGGSHVSHPGSGRFRAAGSAVVHARAHLDPDDHRHRVRVRR